MDLLGGVVSCLSLVFQDKFDVLATVAYGGLVLSEVGIFVLAGILNPKANRRAREVATPTTTREEDTVDMESAGELPPVSII
ncbi:hypothetical protein EXIGLDRAFT_101733 [Exidia glandulosa HHB12029]|uniref:Uncharacterized protein n=1 Tax=Exidia glandulosa HHB12029 TaxID=1314781 RepID=A0A165H0X0_EXIGL|nr:hypothetical protein EXIGLDRAFT_101733 [Exidia glandulosa HHB12029]